MNTEKMNNRVLKHARLFIERDATVRSVAEKTGFSRSTVFLDLTKRLAAIHPELYIKVKDRLEKNKAMRHFKGGYKIQEKWLRRKGN